MARRVLLVLGLATATIGALSAQAQRNPATLDDLVNEVRGLRVEVSRAAGASMRMQLLVARLQLQEQRIITVAGQLTEVRRLLSINEAGQIRPGTQIKEFEEALRNPALPEHMQRDIPGMLSRLKVELGQAQNKNSNFGCKRRSCRVPCHRNRTAGWTSTLVLMNWNGRFRHDNRCGDLLSHRCIT
jgi:hypothetical protein